MKKYTFTTPLILVALFNLSVFSFSCQNNQSSTAETATEISETERRPEVAPQEVRATLEPFEFGDCTPVMEDDSGCSCDFRPEKDNYKSSLFISNIEETACVKVNGSIQSLTGGRIDNRSELYQQSFQEHWITLKEDGTFLIFGEDARPGNDFYKRNREKLVQTLLVMDELPKEIPLQFVGTTGMGMRAEIRDMASEALTIAIEAKANGNTGIPMQMLYKNDQYDILITGNIDGKNDSGGDTYAGTIELKSKDGETLDKKNIWGDCNC